MKKIDRTLIYEEVLKNTNKPRFCYLGYAPPLCIGDEYTKKKFKKESLGKPMLVSCPSALFSTYPALSGSSTPTPFTPKDDRPCFRPAGKPVFDPVGYLPYSSAVKRRTSAPSGGFHVSTANALFHPKIEYMSPKSNLRLAAKKTDLDPFRVSYGSRSSFGHYEYINEGVCLKRAKSSFTGPPFRPAGAYEYKYYEHIDGPPVVEKTTRHQNGPSWKPSGLPLLSSPTCSIALNYFNL